MPFQNTQRQPVRRSPARQNMQEWQRSRMVNVPGTQMPIGDALDKAGGAFGGAMNWFGDSLAAGARNVFGYGQEPQSPYPQPAGLSSTTAAVPVPGGYSGPGGFVGQPQQQAQPPQQMPRLVPGYPMPTSEMHRQQLLSQWNTRYRGTPAPAYLQQPDFRSESPEDFLQRFRQQLAGRAAQQPGNSMQSFEQRAPQPDDAMRGGVGMQRLGVTDQDPTVTRMQNRDGTPNRHFVYGGGPGMGAPGLDVGQVRTHTMVPGGAGVQEIPKPWRGVDPGPIDRQKMLEARARTLYNPSNPNLEPGENAAIDQIMSVPGAKVGRNLDQVTAEANRKRQQLQRYGDAKRAAIAQRAAEIRQNGGGGTLTTDQNGNPLPDSEVVANAADRARGSLPFGERAALVREKAQERSAARRQRIENRNAVPSIYDQMAMEDPRFALQGNALNAQQQMAEADRQARLEEVQLRNQGQIELERARNAQQPIPQNVENMGILAEMPDDIKAADQQTQWEWFNGRKRMIAGEQPEAPGGGMGGGVGGGQIPIGQQSAGFGPMVSLNDERALSQLLARFEGQPDRQREAIEEYGRENGWTPEQIRSAQQTKLGRSWGDWWKSDFQSINPDTGEYELGFGRSMGVLGDPIRQGLNSVLRDVFGARKSRQQQR
jgi:hypothetical protein